MKFKSLVFFRILGVDGWRIRLKWMKMLILARIVATNEFKF